MLENVIVCFQHIIYYNNIYFTVFEGSKTLVDIFIIESSQLKLIFSYTKAKFFIMYLLSAKYYH